MKTLNARYIIGAVAAIAIIALLVANYGMTASIYKTMNQTVKETVQVEMQDLLGDYTPEQVIKTLEQTSTEDINSGVLSQIDYLTDEDKADIVEGVLGVLKPTLLEKLSSSEESVREEVLTSLESTITEKVNTVIENSDLGSTSLTSDEKTILTDSIVSIVESQILKTLSEETSTTTETLNTLEKHVQENVTKIETTLNTYKTEITELQTTIEKIEKELEGQGTLDASKVDEMSKQLTELKSKYNTLVDQYSGHASNALMVSNIITNLTTKPASDMVLSAEAGYTMNQNLINVTNSLASFTKVTEENLKLLGVDIAEFKLKTQQSLDAIEAKTENNQAAIADLESKKADYEDMTEKLNEANSDITNAKSEMLGKINDLQTTEETARNLQIKAIMKDEVERVLATLNGVINDIGTENASTELIEKRNNLSNILTKLESNSDEVTIDNVQEAIDAANTAIIENQSAISRKIASIEQNISNLQNGITTLNESVVSIQNDIRDNQAALEENYAKKNELEAARTALESAQATLKTSVENTYQTKEEALQAAQAASNALDKAINEASGNASQALLEAKADLEASIGDNNSSIEDLETSLSNAKTALEGNIDTIDENITSINGEISTLKNSVTEIKSDISTNKTDISSLKTQMQDNTGKIDNLETANNNLGTQLTAANDSITALQNSTNVKEATSAVSQAITAAKESANKKAEKELQDAKTAIENAYASGDVDAIAQAKSNAETLVNSLKSTLNTQISDNTSKISSLNTTVTGLQTDINSKASQSELNELKKKQPTYTFSGSGSDATVTITVPAQ